MRSLKVFKKLAIGVIATLLMSVVANAQEKGDIAAVLNQAVNTGNGHTNYGIGAKFQYNVTNPIRLEGSITYFFPNEWYSSPIYQSSISMWDFSANGHYLFPVSDVVTLYPLAGLGILTTRNSVKSTDGNVDYSNSKFGLNLGGGVDFKLSDKFILNAEVKTHTNNFFDRFVISVGLAYRFN
ncbi:MAG: porin family protein [Prevotellaceae bacterium]|jgi:outer membrane protein X|nr:porin family protein [Prevotellaceae bacterium]